jgi:hypothetical protein
MPNRVIREGLLDSPRYWSVTVEARQLFVHLLLLADDFGLISLAPVFIRRRAFDDTPSQSKIDQLLEQLHDADLIRIYEIADARFAFIPRFRQTLRIEKAKHPMPPAALFEDDEHAKEKFSKNKDKFTRMQRGRSADAHHIQGTRHTEVEVEVEGKRREANRSPLDRLLRKGTPAPPQPAGGPTFKDEGPTETVWQWSRLLNISLRAGETEDQFKQRVLSAVQQQADAGYQHAKAWLTEHRNKATEDVQAGD